MEVGGCSGVSGNTKVMENQMDQMEKNMEQEMETGFL